MTDPGQGHGPADRPRACASTGAGAIVASGHSKGGDAAAELGLVTLRRRRRDVAAGLRDRRGRLPRLRGRRRPLVVALRIDDPNSSRSPRDGGKTFETRAAPAAAARARHRRQPGQPEAVGGRRPTRARSSPPTRASPGASATPPPARVAWAGPGDALYSAGLDGKVKPEPRRRQVLERGRHDRRRPQGLRGRPRRASSTRTSPAARSPLGRRRQDLVDGHRDCYASPRG